MGLILEWSPPIGGRRRTRRHAPEKWTSLTETRKRPALPVDDDFAYWLLLRVLRLRHERQKAKVTESSRKYHRRYTSIKTLSDGDMGKRFCSICAGSPPQSSRLDASILFHGFHVKELLTFEQGLLLLSWPSCCAYRLFKKQKVLRKVPARVLQICALLSLAIVPNARLAQNRLRSGVGLLSRIIFVQVDAASALPWAALMSMAHMTMPFPENLVLRCLEVMPFRCQGVL